MCKGIVHWKMRGKIFVNVGFWEFLFQRQLRFQKSSKYKSYRLFNGLLLIILSFQRYHYRAFLRAYIIFFIKTCVVRRQCRGKIEVHSPPSRNWLTHFHLPPLSTHPVRFLVLRSMELVSVFNCSATITPEFSSVFHC